MNILIDLLPSEVEINGEIFSINSDFRTSILFENLIQDDEISDKEKIVKTLELYYPVVPRSINEAIEKVLWFYKCGKEDNCDSSLGGGKDSDIIYSFDYDDDYIYAAFLTQYGMDLQDIEFLHWWKFKAMFKSLKDDNEIVRIMGYRAMTISNNMTKEQQEFYRSMKRLHAIPKSKKQKQKINSIEQALLGDGDLSKVL